jgi:hypothetical protein
MRDVIPEVVGKFIEYGDLDFHPHLHALVTDRLFDRLRNVMIDRVSRLLQQHNENDERRWKPSELRANLRQLSNPFPQRPSI